MQSRSHNSSSDHDEKLLKILKISAGIFAEKGFHQTSIRDIARATEMSLSGLYYYFQGKEELLFLIQDHCFQVLMQRWEGSSSMISDPWERLAFFVENHLGFFIHNMDEMKILSHEANSLRGAHQEKMLQVKRRYVRILMDLLKEVADRSGEKPPDLRTAAFCLFGMMNWLYTWYVPKKDLPLEGLVQTLLRIYLFGFLKGESAGANWFGLAGNIPRGQYSMWQDQESMKRSAS
jgi:AcrR family transcriptional regulator